MWVVLIGVKSSVWVCRGDEIVVAEDIVGVGGVSGGVGGGVGGLVLVVVSYSKGCQWLPWKKPKPRLQLITRVMKRAKVKTTKMSTQVR